MKRERDRNEDEQDRRERQRRAVERLRLDLPSGLHHLDHADHWTNEASFISAMKSFSIGGMTLRTACGTITCRSATAWVIPSERAASL